MIKEKSSFSYQKRIQYPKHIIKIIILLIMTGALTWYGEKRTNNPFTSEPLLSIAANDTGLSLYYYSTSIKQSPSIIVNFKGTLNCTEMPKKITSKPWFYISLNSTLWNNPLLTPPIKYWITKSNLPYYIPIGWPSPLYINNNPLTKAVVREIQPFNDNRTAYHVKLHRTTALFINADQFECSDNDVSRFHEKIDLLLLSNASKEKIRYYRSLFRPLFLIVSNDSDLPASEYNNVFIGTAREPQLVTFSVVNSPSVINQLVQ